jgi:CRP/FNR family transcriptional regulator
MTVLDFDAAVSARPERDALTLKYAARKPLFDQAGTAHHIYEITSGSVMIFKLLSDGSRQILEVLRAGDFTGLTRAETYGYSAVTLCPCTLRRFDRRSAATSPAMQKRLANYLLERQEAIYAHTLLLGRKSAAERLALFFAGPEHLGEREHDVYLTLREVSDFLSLRPETVSRHINRLCKLGLLSRSGWGAYRVKDRGALMALAAG